MPDILSLAEQHQLQPRRVSSSKGGEYASSCPLCGGDHTSDRFRIWPEQGEGGKWWCRQCNVGGDCIEFLRKVDGLSFAEASAAMGKASPRRQTIRTPRMPIPPAITSDAPRPVNLPPQEWMDRAAKVLASSHAALLADPEHLSWLHKRGINRHSVIRFRLGWQSSDYLRPYPAWGLPAEKWDNGREKLHLVPVGLVIPWEDGGHILRLRVRQPVKDPKYKVIPGGAKDPQPLMVIDSLWSGPHSAVILCEAELDAILIAQEVGDIVTVIALGSAQTRPHDTRSMDAIRGAAWVGLWLDRDDAGDKATDKWLTDTDTSQDIRPQGTGKMDPGDCYAQGLSIREHVRGSVPPAWRVGPSVRVQEQRGAGAEQEESAEIAPSDAVVRFGRILERTPIVCRVSDAAMSIMALKRRGDGQWVQDVTWEMSNWALMREASRLFWYSAEVQDFLEAHPQAESGVHGKNYWAAMSRKG